VRQPIRLDIINFPGVTCELAEHTHAEIVAGAVTMALENIASPRFQTHIVSEMTQE
jgi:hypothetical protein